MNKIAEVFSRLNHKAFVPYIMAGDGGISSLREKLLLLQDCGVDAIEIGIPFSDPVADGPTIQQAGIRALQNGVNADIIFNELESFKEEIKIPLILMTYANLVYAYGSGKFSERAESAGISGCIIPDLPIEEENLFFADFEKHGLELIRLVTVTSSEERIREISSKGNGYIYAVTVAGITGARDSFHARPDEFLKKVKKISRLPVLAGFGISTPEQVKEIGRHCDGVIVGSKIVDLFHAGDLEGVKRLAEAGR